MEQKKESSFLPKLNMFPNKKLVSIIVPLYNAEKYLDQCIKSIVSQTYSQLEIILINDGSEDNTRTLCQQWAERDKRIVYKEIENSGAAAARNEGLKLVHGDYVSFVDSDDAINKYFCAHLLEYLETYNCDIASCGFQKIKDSDNAPYLKEIRSQKPEIISNKAEQYARLTTINDDINWWVWNKLYKRSLLLNKKFNENLNISEDYRFNWDILKSLTKICYTREKLYYYRMSNNSLTRNLNTQRFFEIIDANEPMLQESKSMDGKTYKNLLRDYASQNLRALELMNLTKKFNIATYQKICRNIRIYQKDLHLIRFDLRILLKAALHSYSLYRVLYFMEIYPKILLGRGKTYRDYKCQKGYIKYNKYKNDHKH